MSLSHNRRLRDDLSSDTGVCSITPAATQKYKDGTQFGVSDASSHGYAKAVVTIKDGKIARVELWDYQETGIPKGPDYKLKAWHKAVEVLPQRFVKANSADIEAATGASSTSKKAVQAVARALDKALVNRPAGGKYFDGVFQGRSEADDHGYAVAVVTIKNDRIVDVFLNERTEKDEWKDYENYPNPDIPKARKAMTERFIEAGDADVDLATGTTHSAEKFVEAVNAALRLAERAAQ